MKYFYVFILFLLTFNLFSQTPPATLWSQTYGGSGSDQAYSVQQTTDGGFIVSGATNSYGGRGYDFWLLKIDENSNEDWTQTYGGLNDDFAYSVQQTTDGGFIAAGYTESYGAGGYDFWLVKTDENGNEDWNQTYGGPESDYAFSVQQTTDGGFIVSGATNSYGAGYYNFWLVKTDENGNEDWNQTFGGSDYEESFSVQQTTDGGYIVAGYTRSYGAGANDFWLVKTDENGNEDWTQTFGGSHMEKAYSVQQTTDGGYIVAGYTYSYGAGENDFWLVKTDENGNEDWNQTYEGSGVANSVQQTTDGGYIATGRTSSYGAGYYDFWLLKTDENGNESWTQTYGGPESDYAFSAQQTTDGGYIIAGHTSSYGAGSSDFWLIRLSAETNSENNVVSIDPFQLSNHPNPFNPTTEISFQISDFSMKSVNLEIYNIKGQKIKSLISPFPEQIHGTQGNNHSVLWNGTDQSGNPVASGIYFATLRSGDRVLASKKMMLLK